MKLFTNLFVLIFLSLPVKAKVLTPYKNEGFKLLQESFEIKSVIKDFAKTRGYNLISPKTLKGTMSLYGDQIIKEKDLDIFVTAILSQAGYTLITYKELKQMEVIPTRDVRYKNRNIYKEIKNVPNTYAHAQFVMNLKHASSHTIARSFRPFMSRYGRIIDERNANTIIIADTGKNIKRLHRLLKKLDTPSYAENKKKVEELNKNGIYKEKSSTSFIDFIKDKHILFIIAFSLIGGIIGFGIRGYLMKRIETGW